MKAYLGDGVYADYDARGLVLTAENGIEATDTIVLERDVYLALARYATGLVQQRELARAIAADD